LLCFNCTIVNFFTYTLTGFFFIESNMSASKESGSNNRFGSDWQSETVYFFFVLCFRVRYKKSFWTWKRKRGGRLEKEKSIRVSLEILFMCIGRKAETIVSPFFPECRKSIFSNCSSSIVPLKIHSRDIQTIFTGKDISRFKYCLYILLFLLFGCFFSFRTYTAACTVKYHYFFFLMWDD